MRFGIIIVLALLVSAVLANAIIKDPGYVVVVIRGYQIETTLAVLLGALAAALFALWFASRVLVGLRRAGEAAGSFGARRASKKLTAGLIEVAEGNFAKGEKLIARAASKSGTPLFSYLQAARAAHLQGEDERRDEWLKLAFERTPEASNAVLLTQAEFQLDRGQYEQALATLREIADNARDHSYALALLGRLYFQLEDWDALRDILPRLEKQAQVKRDVLDTWGLRVHTASLEAAVDAADIDAAWKTVPKRLKDKDALVEAYFDALARVGETARAEKELASSLKSSWRQSLVRRYGLLDGPDPAAQLKRLEGWLKNHPDDAELLLAAARQCLRNELWGKARSYLETVTSLKPSPEAYREYGHLLEQMGESDAAAEAFREGLGLVARSPLPQIPHLAPDEP